MTQTDIIDAAFTVWGEDFYRNTSLSKVADHLGVTKPALYRHFKNKDALLDAMYQNFFNRYSAYIKPFFEKALQTEAMVDGVLTMVRGIAGFYLANPDAFCFTMMEIYENTNPCRNMNEQMTARGIDFSRLYSLENCSGVYPSAIHLAGVTAFFIISLRYKSNCTPERAVDRRESDEIIRDMEVKISSGLGFNKGEIDTIDFSRLEAIVRESSFEEEDDSLLAAVAQVVAEAGPWHASMDMVARRSGRSKSGLYFHFKNKKDMLSRFFITEMERITNRIEAAVVRSPVIAEQLYLAVFTIAEYLRRRPEILVALDWIRVQRIDVEIDASPQMYRIFAQLQTKGSGTTIPDTYDASYSDKISQWMLFLIVTVLMQKDKKGRNYSEIPDKSIRILYKFMVLGLEGW
ncbi:TetR/AcrR family transcriptional regulator [Breznakiella homolactica]|uniref:TetR/AcrR family transcriptional regulator n=1 Tax=Breznakiella homolactica TaxID=2798577 RepID=A0A7T7XNT4_9SPIR|nr:TetR/AcrR family transcriptional regulator [Breznakiella homolactica]QQO09759.1 TetR/AcrR family transcriptional regulator [Breznakiella homolactica]